MDEQERERRSAASVVPAPSRAPLAVLVGTYVLAVAMGTLHHLTTAQRLLPDADNTAFAAVARSLATGHWGRLETLTGSTALSIKFPPLWPATLALGQRVLWFLKPDNANAIWSILIGSTAAPLAGLLAWRLFDRRPGRQRLLLGGGLGLAVAVHPLLVGQMDSLMSEVLVLPLSLGLLLVIDRIHRRGPRRTDLVALGALLGVLALDRVESLAIWGAVLVVLALMTRNWRLVVVPVVTALLPVLAYSAIASAAAHQPVLVATNGASAIAGGNCQETWSGAEIGHWSKRCLDQVWLGRIPPRERALVFAYQRQRADRFPLQLGPRLEGEVEDAQRRGARFAIAHHPTSFLRAVPARIARGLGVWWSPGQTSLEVTEGRIAGWELAGRWFHIILVLPAAALALLALGRPRGRLAEVLARTVDRARLLPLCAALVVWLGGVVVTHGSTRHRAPVDAIFLVAAAVGYAVVLACQDPDRGDVDVDVDLGAERPEPLESVIDDQGPKPAVGVS